MKKVVIIMTDDNKGLWSIYEESGQALEFDFESEEEAKNYAIDNDCIIVETFINK